MQKQRLFVFYIGHPAHYYSSVAIAESLEKKGNDILFLVRPRKMVMDLIKDSPFEVLYISRSDRGNNKLSMLWSIFRRELKLLQIAILRKPFMFIGTDLAIAHIGKLCNIPAIILNEDDESVVPLLARYGFKYSQGVLSPVSCNIETYSDKKIEYEGFHKMLYLAPEIFESRFREIDESDEMKKPYFLLRFSGLNAHHDENIDGIDNDTAKNIVSLLEPHGEVLISSERPLCEELDQYRFSANPKLMHYYLSNAEMLISDSQSMSVEAALLGTPSIRVSSFKGRIGVLEELEHSYHLTFGVDPKCTECIYDKINELLETEMLNQIFEKRRNTMFSEKINVLDFFVWYFDNYPKSHEWVKKDPNYYERFS